MRNFLSNTFKHQGEQLLNRSSYAYALIVLFSVLPFFTWIAVSIVAFITLRQGASAGVKALGVGLLTCYITTFLSTSLSFSNQLIIFIAFFPCFFSAWLLRLSANLNFVALCLLLTATAAVIFCYYFPPYFLIQEYRLFQSMMKNMKTQGWVILMQPDQAKAILLGIQAASSLLATIMSLLLARGLQAKLFYPEGFQKELLSFRIYTLTLIPFSIILLGLYQHSMLAVSLLPIWVLYMASAGYSTIASLFSGAQSMLLTALLIVVTLLLPRIFVPFIVGVGVLDNFMHFRKKFNKQSSRGS